MLKRICKRKLIISSIILTLILFLYKTPNSNKYSKNTYNKMEQRIKYINYQLKTNDVYLIDNNNYLSRVKIATENEDKKLIYELLNILTCNSSDQDKIPNGFKCVLNEKTKVNSVSIKNNTLKIDLSKDFLETNNEEQVIESLVYTLTALDTVNNIIIYKEGKLLDKLPKSNITLPSTLNRNIGINKKYELTNTNKISKTNIYYINKVDDMIYYTPITLINNDAREKIEIIIDELSNKIIDSNLSSYLNSNTKVLNSYIENDTIHVNFNENILNDFNDNNILEEVIYTISLSINDNYNVKNVFFDVNDKEIAKTTIKSLE